MAVTIGFGGLEKLLHALGQVDTDHQDIILKHFPRYSFYWKSRFSQGSERSSM